MRRKRPGERSPSFITNNKEEDDAKTGRWRSLMQMMLFDFMQLFFSYLACSTTLATDP